MSQRRLALLSLVLFSLVLLGGAKIASIEAATIDPGLLEQFMAKGPDAKVRVVLLMEDRLDLEGINASLAGRSVEARRQAVVEALRSYATVSQRDAMESLRGAEAAGDVDDIRVLWIMNAVAFRANRDAVVALGNNKAAAYVTQDLAHESGTANAADTVVGRKAHVAGKKANVWSIDWINADDVWVLGYDGSGVVIGHVDGGAWMAHPDMAGQLWVNSGEIPSNSIDDDDNGYVDDVNGFDFGDDDSNPNDDVVGNGFNHGTHTAGTLVGNGTNGTATGVAPGAKVMLLKVTQSDGSGAFVSDVYEAQQYGLAMGARLFSMSLGVGGQVPAWQMAAERSNGDVLRTAGLPLFVSAGNDGSAFNPPHELSTTARVPSPWATGVDYSSRGGVISVGGTGYQSDGTYVDSSKGPADWGEVPPWNDWNNPGNGLIKPDLVAPGVNVNSLMRPSGYTGDAWTGTSMSTPHVSGVAALMLDKNPSLSPEDIDMILQTTAVELGTAGKDNTYGSGRVDALAAVNAVTFVMKPYVIVSQVTIQDQGGDGIIDPGESFDLVVELSNNSPLVSASGVAVVATVAANPHISVTDGNAAFPNLGANGDSGTNLDALSFTSVGGTPQGFEFTVFFDISTNQSYATSIDQTFSAGLPMFRDHNVGAVLATVTAQGSIGYLSPSQTQGNGFQAAGDSDTDLFIGSFWGGNAASYICNRDYTPDDPAEWVLMSTPKNGRVRQPSYELSDQDYISIYDDAGLASSKGIEITQHSMAWNAEDQNEFVIIRYSITNNGGSAVNNYYAGVFADWDIDLPASSDPNRAGTDAARNLSYVYDTGGGSQHYGIAVLDPTPAANISVIHNPTYVYVAEYITNANKYNLLTGTLSFATGNSNDDWSCMASAGPFNIGVGETVKASFALVYGDNLQGLRDNTDAAAAMLASIPTASGPLPTLQSTALWQNVPNPFNPSTTITFVLERSSSVKLVVFDLTGRRVRTLADGRFEAGQHPVLWDGRDGGGLQVASGTYLYQLKVDGESLAKKMLLIK